MSEGQKIAAWTAFGTIGGGALNVLFNWLFCLAMNAVIEGDRFEADFLRSFALGAIACGTALGGSCLWQMKRRWWATLAIGAGYAMLTGVFFHAMVEWNAWRSRRNLFGWSSFAR